MSRRIQRIYPAFLAVYLLYIALSFAFPTENKIPPSPAAGTIYLIENFLLLPGLLPIVPMIGVAWSLSYEMFFYLAIPLVIALLRLREWNPGRRAALFLIVAGATVSYCAVNGGHIRLILFISGMLAFEAMNSYRVPTPSGRVGLLALAAGLLATLLPVEGPSGTAVKVGINFFSFFIFGLACFGNASGWLARWFSWTPMRWLGNMSYSYYLVHGVALRAAFLALSFLLPGASYGAWFFWVSLPAMFVLTLLPSAALFLLVERPFSLVARRPKSARPNAVLHPGAGDAVGADVQKAARRLP
jgi:peptidoglycan/LPS O-acetylase OafA/YrhL